MTAGFYADRESALHRLHPVTKIIALSLSFAAALLTADPIHLAVMGLFFILAGIRAGAIPGIRRVLWLLVLVALASFGIWSLAFHGPTAVAALGPLTATREGMIYGAGMGLRLVIMAVAGLVFLAATPVEDITYGLTRLGIPFPVSFALSLSFRLVPLFSSTIRTVADAQRARGLDPDAGGLVARVRNFIPLLSPVFAGALRRTDLLSVALESKGFGRGGKRGSLKLYPAGAADAAALFIMAALVALLSAARVLGWDKIYGIALFLR